MKVKKFFRASRGRITATHTAFVSGRTTQKMLPTGLSKELRQAQLNDREIKPVLEWLERSQERPSWEEIAPHSDSTKVYCAQWQSLRLLNGVLYRLWETPSGDAITKQLILP